MKKNYYFRLTPKRIAFTLPMKRLSSRNESPLLFILIAFHFLSVFLQKEALDDTDETNQSRLLLP